MRQSIVQVDSSVAHPHSCTTSQFGDLLRSVQVPQRCVSVRQANECSLFRGVQLPSKHLDILSGSCRPMPTGMLASAEVLRARDGLPDPDILICRGEKRQTRCLGEVKATRYCIKLGYCYVTAKAVPSYIGGLAPQRPRLRIHVVDISLVYHPTTPCREQLARPSYHSFNSVLSLAFETMPESIINESDLALDRYDGNIFVITMRKAPENRLNSAYAQKLIGAFNTVRKLLGPDSEGAVITKGNDTKFWCTVGSPHVQWRTKQGASYNYDDGRADKSIV